MGMNRYEFGEALTRFEAAWGRLSMEQVSLYFDHLKFYSSKQLKQSLEELVDAYEEKCWPGIPAIHRACEEVALRSGSGGPLDFAELEFCQRCENRGIYLSEDGGAKFCRCAAGRAKLAVWRLPTGAGAGKRKEAIEKELRRGDPPEPPTKGLKVRNELDFWEDSQEVHDLWCAAKRKQIEEIKRRREEFEEKRRMEKKVIVPGSLKRVIDETLAQVAEAKKSREPADREPGEDEEEEEVPF